MLLTLKNSKNQINVNPRYIMTVEDAIGTDGVSLEYTTVVLLDLHGRRTMTVTESEQEITDQIPEMRVPDEKRA